jgi:hypothetical protein
MQALPSAKSPAGRPANSVAGFVHQTDLNHGPRHERAGSADELSWDGRSSNLKKAMVLVILSIYNEQEMGQPSNSELSRESYDSHASNHAR